MLFEEVVVTLERNKIPFITSNEFKKEKKWIKLIYTT